MKSITVRISLAASLLILLALVGALPTRSDNGKARINQQSGDRATKGRARPGVKQLSYRSPGATHKLLVPADDADIGQQLMSSRSARKSKKYGAYSLVEVTETELSAMNASTLGRANLRDDLNLVMLKPGQIDTTGPEPIIANDLRQHETGLPALHLVQLFGPPTPESLAALKATGAKVVGYVPNNAYLMWTTRAERRQLHALRQSANGSSLVQWDGPYHPAYKLDSHLKLNSVEQISVSISILDTPEADNTVSLVKFIANKVLMAESRAAGAVRINVLAEPSRLKELANAPDVLAIEPWSPMKLMDERADQIVAGALSFSTVNNIQISQPSGPGYLAFLNSLGFNADFDFAIDFGDTGFDRGSADPDPLKMHPDFLNAAGASRVAYLHDFSHDSHPSDSTILPTHDVSGHGTINASIAGGFNNQTGNAVADAQGFRYGLGVAPFARIGVSKVFNDNEDTPRDLSYTGFIAAAYQGGARVSSNSWGDSIGSNQYNFDSQEFDSLVRDADPFTFGNQAMVIVFAAGNAGDGGFTSVASPGTAKNVITVGASENVRPGIDGCGFGPSFADNGQDILFFSGYGPVEDGRAKPDLVAPGSHMQGAASRDKLFAATGVCSFASPEGTIYTTSTGTSQATPVVSGAAALAYQWLRTNFGAEPSPALVKALILNSTSYLDGRFGGDSLPGAHQGWGLLNLGRMFESTSRIIFDESPSRTFTESGGAPFEATGVVADSTKEVRVMLVWTDPPGNAATNAPYVNQLALEVIAGGVAYTANHFSGQYSTPGSQKDFTNNVQGVRLPAGTTGPIVVRVRPNLIAGDGVPGDFNPLDQDFALVVTNGIQTAIPVLAVDSAGDVAAGVTVQHSDGKTDASLIAGETASITVTVRNQSQTITGSIQGATLTLGSAQSSAAFNAIPPGQTRTNTAPFQIQVPSGLRCGSVSILQLQIDTSVGRFTLPVRVQIGRFSKPGGPAEVLLFDDADSFSVKWKRKGGFDTIPGPATSGTVSHHVEDPGARDGDDDSRFAILRMKKDVAIPDNAGQVRLSFFHIFNFEPGFDGGVLEFSTDDGENWQDAGSRMLVGGYDGQVTDISSNPLGTVFAWTARGKPGVFSQVVVDLSDLAGKRVRLRFLAGFDEAAGVLNGYTGWFIDDIQITAVMYSCGQAQAESEESTAAARPENAERARARRGPLRVE